MPVRLVQIIQPDYQSKRIGVVIWQHSTGIATIRNHSIGGSYFDPDDFVPFVGPLSKEEQEKFTEMAEDNGFFELGYFEDQIFDDPRLDPKKSAAAEIVARWINTPVEKL